MKIGRVGLFGLVGLWLCAGLAARGQVTLTPVTAGSINGVVSSNNVWYAGTNALIMTNYTSGGEISPVLDTVMGVDQGYFNFWSQTPGDHAYGYFQMNPRHDGVPGSPGKSEATFIATHNLSLGYSVGFPYGQLQIGIGNNLYATNKINPYLTNGSPDQIPGDIGQGKMAFLQPALSSVRTNSYSGNLVFDTPGVVGANNYDFYPGLFGEYVSSTTNAGMPYGIYRLRIARDFGIPQTTPQWDRGGVVPGIDVLGGNYYAEKLWGGVIQHKVTGYATTNTVINLVGSQVVDLVCAQTNVAVSTTNGLAGLLDQSSAGRCTVLLRSRGFTNVYPTWPKWCTNSAVALPTLFAGTNILRLDLEWTGVGETNVNVVSVTTNADSSMYWDQNALSFLGQIGANSTLQVSNAINNYVIHLKNGDGAPWNSASNLYPFVATTAASNLFNLINTNNYRLVPHGTVTATVQGANFDGSSGWFNTQMTYTSANHSNAALFGWVKTNCNIANATLIGTRTAPTPNNELAIRVSPSTSFRWNLSGNDPINSGATTAIGTNGPCVGRLWSERHAAWLERGVTTLDYAGVGANVPLFPVYIGDLDESGSNDGFFWSGLIQVAGCFGGLSLMQYQTLYDATAGLNISLYR